MASLAGDNTIKRASLLGLSMEIRLQIYGYLLTSRGPVDEIFKLEKIAKQRVQAMSDLAPDTGGIDEWDPRALFSVCRRIYAEAMPFFYGQNTFELFSPTQGLHWITELDKYPSSLLRSLSVPISLFLRGQGQLLMEMLTRYARNLRTLYIGKKWISHEDYLCVRGIRSWTKGPSDDDHDGIDYNIDDDMDDDSGADDDDGINPWRRQANVLAKTDFGHADDTTPLGGPFRRIVAAGRWTEAEDKNRKVLGDLAQGYVLYNLQMLPQLTTVYVNDTFGPEWDDEVAWILAELEAERERKRMVAKRSIFGPREY